MLYSLVVLPFTQVSTIFFRISHSHNMETSDVDDIHNSKFDAFDSWNILQVQVI